LPPVGGGIFVSTETESRKFAQIDLAAMLLMNAYLKPLEYQLFTIIKMEEFLGGGICRLKIKEIAAKYLFKNKDYLSHAGKRLRLMNWIVKVQGGYICQTDFSQLKPLSEEKIDKKLRNSKFLDENTGNKTPNDAEKLRISKQKTSNFKVLNLEFQSFSGANKEESLKPKEQFCESIDSQNSFASTGEGERAAETGGDVKTPAKILKPKKIEEPPKIKTPRKRDIDFENLAALCFLKKTPLERQTLNEKERGQLNQNLKKLRVAEYDLSKIGKFEQWWKTNWRSGTNGKTYEPPRPEQVVTFWNVAMEFEQIIADVKKNDGMPVWVTVGKNTIDVLDNYDRDGNFVKKRLDEEGRREALECLIQMKADGLSILDMCQWYQPEDWDWLTAEVVKFQPG